MAKTTVPWFVAERSEAIAGLLLTARSDVRVQKARKHDDGVDFFMEVNTGEPLSTRLFVVQVKGATSDDPDAWMETVKPLFGTPKKATLFLPACVFVVNVRDNRSVFAWLAEPIVEGDRAVLGFREAGDFRQVDATVIDEIVERVKTWYEAFPAQLASA